MNMDVETRRIVERCFREKRREMILVLARKFGAHRLDDIDNAIQGAMEKALSLWPQKGTPPNPVAWFIVVAQNLMLDMVRKDALVSAKVPDVSAALYPEKSEEPLWAGPLEDDVLKMMVVCAHPELKPRETAVIILRLICNLGVEEISKGLLTTTAAVKKQLTRAKQKIRDLAISFDLPPPDQLDVRLERILQCIYLLYNEGYSAYVGDNLIRRELCVEAERLVELLLKSSLEDKGRIWALSALLSFQSSRIEARTCSNGRLVRLADQDRSRWNQEKIASGLVALGRSMGSTQRSRYHLEAAIAACHATAQSYADTDWSRIREFYEDLAALFPSPVVDLNRSVAILMTDGPDPAIELLSALDDAGKLHGMYLLPALLGDFHRRAGRADQAAVYYRRALGLSQTEPVQHFLLGQMEVCMLG